MVFEENFPRLRVTACSQKNEYIKNLISPFYNNLVATNYIYISPNSENRGFTSLIKLQV